MYAFGTYEVAQHTLMSSPVHGASLMSGWRSDFCFMGLVSDMLFHEYTSNLLIHDYTFDLLFHEYMASNATPDEGSLLEFHRANNLLLGCVVSKHG